MVRDIIERSGLSKFAALKPTRYVIFENRVSTREGDSAGTLFLVFAANIASEPMTPVKAENICKFLGGAWHVQPAKSATDADKAAGRTAVCYYAEVAAMDDCSDLPTLPTS